MEEALGDMSNLKIGLLFNLPFKQLRGENIDYIAESEVMDQVEAVENALERLGFKYQTFPLKDDIGSLIQELKLYKPHVVINLCEGAFGDSHLEMHIPSILELLRIPYTGSPPLALGISQNKGLTKALLIANGIPTPNYVILSSYEEWRGELDYPLFVKPLMEDASLGISKKSFVKNDPELEKQVRYIRETYRQPALVEEYIAGRELNVAILGYKCPEVLPISEILFEFSDEPKIVDYSAKWLKDSEEYKRTKPVCPAKLDPCLRDEVAKLSLKAFKVLCCRDYARVDIRLKGRKPYVLEVNPNPDISPEAGFVRSLKAAGISFEEFIRRIIFFALERRGR